VQRDGDPARPSRRRRALPAPGRRAAARRRGRAARLSAHPRPAARGGDAIAHIAAYGTGHSDAIVTDSVAHARAFTTAVDSAAVYVNASTRFTDGFEFGFGAEVGISTNRLHARGPMGLRELTTYKYVIHGSGQIRS
jgi:hypothetical protein